MMDRAKGLLAATFTAVLLSGCAGNGLSTGSRSWDRSLGSGAAAGAGAGLGSLLGGTVGAVIGGAGGAILKDRIDQDKEGGGYDDDDRGYRRDRRDRHFYDERNPTQGGPRY